MASVRSQIDKILRKYKKTLTAAQQDRVVLNELGRLEVDRIQRRTRAGRGCAKERGPEFKLEKLSPGYIEQRRRRRSELDGTTQPGRSNLTFTGEMLRAVSYKIKARAGEVLIFLKGQRNKKIARYHEGEGRVDRPFFHLSNNDYRKINETYRRFIRVLVQRLNR